MEKNTKILIGAGALALAYYLYNASKASATVTTSAKTPISPSVLTEVTPDEKTLEAIKAQLAILQSNPNNYNPRPIGFEPIKTDMLKVVVDGDQSSRILAEIAAEESARQEAIAEAQNKANQEAYLKSEADIKSKNDANILAAKLILDEAIKKDADAKAKADADEVARQKVMNAFMYPTCPDGFEWYQNQCAPSNVVQERKVTEQANNGEGLILRDYNRPDPQITLVKNCPSEYVKVGIECMAKNMLSWQQLQEISMKEAGMVQTSDGQWYTNAAAAAAAQAIIDARGGVSYDAYGRPVQNQNRTYSARQSSINDAICSITTAGVINNPYSAYTNGMSLSQYIGEFKVTANELRIARASCPNSVYSSGRIAGGYTDDETLGYK